MGGTNPDEHMLLDDNKYIADVLYEVKNSKQKDLQQSRLLFKKRMFRETDETITEAQFVNLSYVQVLKHWQQHKAACCSGFRPLHVASTGHLTSNVPHDHLHAATDGKRRYFDLTTAKQPQHRQECCNGMCKQCRCDTFAPTPAESWCMQLCSIQISRCLLWCDRHSMTTCKATIPWCGRMLPRCAPFRCKLRLGRLC